MRESSFPGLADHQKAHDVLIKRLMALSAEHEKPRGHGLQPAEVGQWINEWLETHVAGLDMELARHMRAHGLPARQATV